MDQIKEILFNGTNAQKKYLFSFDNSTNVESIVKKFEIFTRYFYPKFFKSKDASFHKDMIYRMINLYKGEGADEFLNIGFRGCSKTTFTKLFIAFILANDTEHNKKYIKILSSDIKNSKQMVTDIYNMLISPRVIDIYPELFEKTEQKRQETMDIIDFATGVKVTAGTVGQIQRGNVQGFEEASRPDFLIFDDIETRDSLRSAVKTRSIWDSMQEAINGLAVGGITIYLANYISERGNIHRLLERIENKMIIPIIENGIPTWERYNLKQIALLKAKAEDWEGEYLCKPSASKDTFISREEIDKQISIVFKKNIGGLKIFKDYNPSNRIAGGHDIALGVGLDSSTSVFIDFDTLPCQVIATYHNNEIKPDSFGDEIAKQGQYFGECLLAPEKNNAGISTIDRLKLIYPIQRIHATQRKLESIQYSAPIELGWDTNGVTKGKMMNDLSEAIENGWLSLNDEDLIREARSYTRNDLMEKQIDARMVTKHFDLLIACAIAWQMKDFAKKSTKIKTNSFNFNIKSDLLKVNDRSFE